MGERKALRLNRTKDSDLKDSDLFLGLFFKGHREYITRVPTSGYLFIFAFLLMFQCFVTITKIAYIKL